MKLSLLFTTSISTLFYIASASQQFDVNPVALEKRDHGLPYASLPSATCATPSTCSSISGTVTCRCSDTVTTCINTSGQYCWGSISLNSTSCPTVPESCSSTLTGTTTSCLCNDKNVLCVDNANNYCYGSVNAGAVSVLPIPYAASSSASASASASSSIPVASGTTNPTMSVVGAPSIAASATPSTSGSNTLTTSGMLSLGCAALIAYIAI
ncbi:hypothetical protein V8B55DRAFT_1496982 [Mucor lusitanicus]|uniref:Secreted protein n=2 Tax=Mucor circinelloides f. lusitanicus TaxID=29924 RepID=A0A168MRI5_MUCCL|nr:hypothetical protein FB192DRAFT_1426574 [Mucor lusitanicus]OAD05278.1 hypothetical protein MUCCIDRAFT_155853 [Mucor lusitanicus CBS 277.49]